MDIKVLGSSCAKCKKLEERTREAVKELGLDATITKIEDIQEIISFGVMMTPALVIDGEVVMSGQLPSVKELKKTLGNK